MGVMESFAQGGQVAIAVGFTIALLNGLTGRFSKTGDTMTDWLNARMGGGQ